MTFSRIICCAVCYLILAITDVHSVALGQDSTSVLWGSLNPGSYAVGYRVVYAFDRSRTWHRTRTYSEPQFSADVLGRPVRISVWYPAIAGNGKMRITDYIHNRAPETFRTAEAALEKRDARVVAEWVPAQELGELMQTSVRAYRDARPVAATFPLVLYSAGVNAYTESNMVMAEFLASHGFVVATVPSLGESDAQPEQTFSKVALETSTRDMEFAWSVLRQEPNVSQSGFGIFGHSLGGVVALMVALRNSDVLAVAGLDGTYGFVDGHGWLTDSERYDPQRMQAALLDVRRADAKLDLQALESFHHSDRTLVALRGMTHGDFTSFVTGATTFHLDPPREVPVGWTREVAFRGYQLVCTAVLDFFAAELRNDSSGQQRLAKDLSDSIIASSAFKPGAPLVPSADEFLNLIQREGVNAAVQLANKSQRESPCEAVVDERVFNQAGYSFIADKQFEDAARILEFVARVYPQSANAADSLGDAYLAAGQKENALAAFRRAVDLLPLDRTLNEAGKTAIESDAKAKIHGLAPK
jgi:pimeloyl-ACP methyl ester carboxylesterase